MRVMVSVMADADAEAGVLPNEQILTEMGAYNEELVKAGIILDGGGLMPSSAGARVRLSGTERTVIRGPYAEPTALVAGYWIWRVDSLEEAIEWAKRCPNPMGGESELDIRPLYEAEDFGEASTPERRERDERLRPQSEGQQGA